MRVLLAGSTGAIGREVGILLDGRGLDVRRPTRRSGVDALRPETLRGLCDGLDVVVSAMGGSVSMSAAERRPYRLTNARANENLFAEAVRAGVRRIVYVGAHPAPGYDQTAYIRAHAAVGEWLSRASVSHTVVRPTGVFTALAPLVAFARWGVVPVFGDGAALTNPIHARDVALAVVAHLEDGPRAVSVGGPDVLTRRAIAEAARCERYARILSVPGLVARANARVAGVVSPRLGELIAFAAAVSVVDSVAPPYGSERLTDYFTAIGAQLG